MIQVYRQLFIMFAVIFIGYFLKKNNQISPKTEKEIAGLIINIGFPSLIFFNILTEFQPTMIDKYFVILLAGIIITFFSLFVGYINSIIFGIKNKKLFSFLATFSNNVFIGAPVCLALFGSQGFIMAILYDFGMGTMLWSAGIWFVSDNYDKKAGGNLHIKEFFRNIFSPPLISLFIGFFLAFNGLNVPEVFLELTEMIGNITIPLAMIFIGLQIAKSNKIDFINRKIFMLSLIRLLLIPLAVLFFIRYLNFEMIVKNVIVVVASMPVFASSPVILEKYAKESEFASEAVFSTTLLFILTFPIILFVLF